MTTHVFRIGDRVNVFDKKQELLPARILQLVVFEPDRAPASVGEATNQMIAARGSSPPGARLADHVSIETPHAYAVLSITPPDGLNLPLQAVYATSEILRINPPRGHA